MYKLRHGAGEKTTKIIFQRRNVLIEHADTESAKQKVKTLINCNIVFKNDSECLKMGKAVSFTEY